MVSRLVQGVGINDADYSVTSKLTVGTWKCPYYSLWEGVVRRSYSAEFKAKRQTYYHCVMDESWLYFSVFKEWVMSQKQHDIWHEEARISASDKVVNLSLDKDILSGSVKRYSPETCAFIPAKLNSLLTDSRKARGIWPIGVHSQRGKFKSQITMDSQVKYLGLYTDQGYAHAAWQKAKYENINQQAAVYENQAYCDSRICRRLYEIAAQIEKDYLQNVETVEILGSCSFNF